METMNREIASGLKSKNSIITGVTLLESEIFRFLNFAREQVLNILLLGVFIIEQGISSKPSVLQIKKVLKNRNSWTAPTTPAATTAAAA